MIHSTDLLTLALTAIGKYWGQKKPEISKSKDFSAILRVSLGADSDDFDCLEIFKSEKEKVSFFCWNEGLKQEESLISIPLVSLQDLSAPAEISPLITHAFHGNNALVMGVRRKTGLTIYRPKIVMPARYTFTAKEFIRFVEVRQNRESIVKQLLWQNEYNLHFSDKQDWDSFVQSFTDDKIEELMLLWDLCFSGEDAGKIYAEFDVFFKDYQNPNTKVTYVYQSLGEVEVSESFLSALLNVKLRRIEFQKALGAIRDFAMSRKAEKWALHFQKLYSKLDGVGEDSDDLLDLFKQCGMEGEAQILFNASIRSDVFGGMGSWNDVHFSDDPEYTQVSQDFYRELYLAVSACVNASLPLVK